MAHHNHYWSCSAFADWIRGTIKPTAASMKDWRLWKDYAKDKSPVRYWIAEEGLDLVQDFITWPARKLYSVSYYCRNRFITKTHALTSDPKHLKRGQWCDLSNRFLPCMFNELVEFVEVELAWWHIAWSDKDERAKYNAPFWAWGWFKSSTWRSKQAGLDNLNWQMGLVHEDLDTTHPDYNKPTRQAVAAKEIYDLYTWWTEVYSNRPDAMEISGWSDWCAKRRQDTEGSTFWEDTTEEDAAETRRMIDLSDEIEQKYIKEDEEMMIRLIKIREALWT